MMDWTEPMFEIRPQASCKRALLCSALLHLSVTLFLVRVPLVIPYKIFFPGPAPEFNMVPRDAKVIYYDLEAIPRTNQLPTIRVTGTGGQPGTGVHFDKQPTFGSSVRDPHLFMVVRSPNPDNNRQTILQPASPPHLKITAELRLPDVVVPVPVLAAQPEIKPAVIEGGTGPAKQIASRPQVAHVAAPEIRVVAAPGESVPRLALPVSAAVPVGPAKTEAEQGSIDGTGRTAGAANASGLLIISADPGPPTDLLALPPGNRYGSFSVATAGTSSGSPGGHPGGVPGGGRGGTGEGGDDSAGVGRSGAGGGGAGGAGKPEDIVSVNIAGGQGMRAGLRGGASPESATLAATVGLIFPVIVPPHLRRSSLVLYTGPVGGGGLDVYGVLQGGKIYTIFLSMRGQNWILQYCAPSTDTAQAKPQRGVVQFGESVTPPDAIERFDFKRVPVPADKLDKKVILRGRILKDGSLSELKVHKGVQPDLDALALAAFARWKFAPALRGKDPVPVEILVGIPVSAETRATTEGSMRVPAPNPVADAVSASALEKVAASTATPAHEERPSPSDQATNLLRKIFHSSDSERTLVAIETDAPIAYQVNTAKNPDRIYLDLKGAHLASDHHLNVPEARDGRLKGIRVGQFDVDVIRVVLDLQKPANYSISRATNPDRLIVELNPVDASGARRASIPKK